MLFDSEKTQKKGSFALVLWLNFIFQKKIQLAMGTLFGQVW